MQKRKERTTWKEAQPDLLFPLEFTTPMTLGDASATLMTPPTYRCVRPRTREKRCSDLVKEREHSRDIWQTDGN
jgi:hypothetical protein